MLCLTRKKNDAIFIGDDITVTVLEIRGDKVRLGITAPENINIVRDNAIKTKHEFTEQQAQP